MKKLTIAAAAFLLAACGAPKTENSVGANSANNGAANSNSVAENKTAENKTVEAAKPQSANLESRLLNACLVLPKEEVEKILGQAVDSANLSRAVEGTGSTAALSQCTYQTAGGQTIEFFARRSPVADNTPQAIQEVRQTMKKVTQKDVEEITGVGKAAFWVSVVNQLHVFEGENVYLFLTMRNFKNVEEAKTKSVELARRATAALAPQ